MQRRSFLATTVIAITLGSAGCTEETEVGGPNSSLGSNDSDVTVNEYRFEVEENSYLDDDVVLFVEVENNTNEEQTVVINAELYEDDLLLAEAGPYLTLPPEATRKENSTFFDLNPEDIERVTNYVIRGEGFWSDPVVISEGTGDEFRNDLRGDGGDNGADNTTGQ
jgi:hypothetical protein